MGLMVPLASQSVTTSNATFGSAVPTGQLWRLRAVNWQQPSVGTAKVISLAIGTTATAGNIKRRYSLASGVQNGQDFPDIVLVAGEQLNIVCDTDTGVAILSATVIKELIA